MTAASDEQIMTALSSVIDPELRIDIVNLGLINHVHCDDKGHVVINMTLTTMGCPLTALLTEMIDEALKILPAVTSTEVVLQWEPSWTIDRMSRYAKMALGL